MLDTFIVKEREEILARSRLRAAARPGSRPELPNGLPIFLGQLVTALRLADSTDQIDHHEIRKSAAERGKAMLRSGVSVEEVVHEYGDVCQTVTELAIEREQHIPTAEFRVMNLCLDDAIAEAVAEFGEHAQRSAAPGVSERSKEQRRLLATARTSFDFIQRGQVAVGGATGKLVQRSLAGLSALSEDAERDPPITPK